MGIGDGELKYGNSRHSPWPGWVDTHCVPRGVWMPYSVLGAALGAGDSAVSNTGALPAWQGSQSGAPAPVESKVWASWAVAIGPGRY